jgi:hypothetical protein
MRGIPPGNFNQRPKKREMKAMEKLQETPKINELCKFYKTGSCQKGDDCPYSHNSKFYPCKFIHSTGTCKFGDNCDFSHRRLEPNQIMIFIEENEDFLDQVFAQNGTTNLGEYYHHFKREKDKRRQEQQREQYAAKLKSSLLPEDMKRDLIATEVDSRFTNSMPQEPLPQSRMEPVGRMQNVRDPNYLEGRNMRQEQFQRQAQPHVMREQPPREVQRHIEPQINQVPPNLQRKVSQPMIQQRGQSREPMMQQRMPIRSQNLREVQNTGQAMQEGPIRGVQGYSNSVDNDIQNRNLVQMYSSPAVGQPSMPQGDSRPYMMTKSPLRNDEYQNMPQRQIPQNPRVVPFNPNGRQSYPQQYQRLQNQRSYDNNSDENEFFNEGPNPKLKSKNPDDILSELAKIGILPENYEELSDSDDSNP